MIKTKFEIIMFINILLVILGLIIYEIFSLYIKEYKLSYYYLTLLTFWWIPLLILASKSFPKFKNWLFKPINKEIN